MFYNIRGALQLFILSLLSISSYSHAFELITNFNTQVAQVTQAKDSSLYTPQFIRHEYSRRPAFNADGSMAIMYSSNGFFHLYAVNPDNSLSYLHILDQIGGGVIEPNWHPSDPNLLYAFNPYGIGMQLNLFDVRDQERVNVVDMGRKIKALGGSFAIADRAFTGEEGRPSRDGNIWCLAVYSGENWAMQGMIAYDIAADNIIAFREMSEGPDAISTSPSGDYCVSIGGWGGSGIRAYPISDASFNSFRQLHQTPEHVDLAIDAEQRDVMVFIDSQNDGHVKAVDLETGRVVRFFDTWDAEIAPAAHFSGIGYAQPGWAIVSMFGGSQSSFYHNKILAVEITENPRIIVLADTQHRGNMDYFAQPQASVNFQLDKVLFASDISGQIADYMISIEAELPLARSIMSGSDDIDSGEESNSNNHQNNEGGSNSETTQDNSSAQLPTEYLQIAGDSVVYFQQESELNIRVQTNLPAQCRWDYADGNTYPFDALYQNVNSSTNGLVHTFSEYAWQDHSLYVVCKTQAGDEADKIIQVLHTNLTSNQNNTDTGQSSNNNSAIEGIQIIADNQVNFQHDSQITVSIQTDRPAQCRWDYADGNYYPFDVLYQGLFTQDNKHHSFSEYAWNDHNLYVVCQAEDGSSEVDKTIQVRRIN